MDTFWDWFWLMVWWFCFIAYLILLFHIVADLFRDRGLNGWLKALWIVALIVLPFLAALVYVIGRGKGMADRSAEAAVQAKQATDEYIRQAAGSGRSAADDIAQAKALYDAGVVDEREYARLKEKALT
ncbi:SHOCT domain-containing protein [Puerhibacterium puerhi]|uniref:SHOCT domain-containing protein n=1 Tax=Puerhibacterium puerhi TaxID=2692623 RepID=UPI001356C802|nr:SHOCT domain-containing protein [Puerhibacterium puerhi]